MAMNYIMKFVNWYSNNIEKSMIITLVILLSQIPHFFWGGDVLLQSGYIANANPITDFILYGVDLFEIPLIIKTIADVTILYKNKRRKNVETNK